MDQQIKEVSEVPEWNHVEAKAKARVRDPLDLLEQVALDAMGVDKEKRLSGQWRAAVQRREVRKTLLQVHQRAESLRKGLEVKLRLPKIGK